MIHYEDTLVFMNSLINVFLVLFYERQQIGYAE